MSNKVGSIYYVLSLNTTEFDKAIGDVGGKLRNVSQKLSSAGKKMTLGITLPIIATGGAAIKAAADYEQLSIAMETMLGDADQAKKILKDLDDLAVETPFQISEVQQSAKQMLAYGIEADKVVETTRMLGDVSAGLGTHTFPQLTLAYGQIKAKGKLMGQELLQLTNAGFNLAEAMGVSRGELMDMMQTAEGVSFEQVEQAFINTTSEGGRFFEMMKNQSETTAGQFSNLQDETTRLLREIGQELLPVANDLIRWAKKAVEWFGGLDSTTKKVIMVTAGLTATIGPLLIIIAKLISAIRVIKGAMLAFNGAMKVVRATSISMKASLMGSVGAFGLIAGAAIAAGIAIQNAFNKLSEARSKARQSARNASSSSDLLIQTAKEQYAAGKITLKQRDAMLQSALLPVRARGGPVTQGQPYIVGEEGPEVFMPNESGQIIPNNKMGGMNVYGGIHISERPQLNAVAKMLGYNQELSLEGVGVRK